jgi:hypothetical protein
MLRDGTCQGLGDIPYLEKHKVDISKIEHL